MQGIISDCLHLKQNLKNCYLYVNSTSQRCPNKIIKTFWIQDFFHLPPVLKVVHLELQIFKMALMRYSVAWGKLIHEKNPEVENLMALSL
jgi:hypothetical protein